MAETRKYSDRAEYLKKAVSKRRKSLKVQAIKYKGGQCVVCGYSTCNEALEFHHLDPDQKDFGISQRGITRSWEKIREELDKCILICSNCHKEVHAGITQLSLVTKIE